MTERAEPGNLWHTENIAEMARISRQARVINVLTGLHPAQVQFEKGMHVLDIASGPGQWALALAEAYPDIDVIGLDISEIMTTYAESLAREQGLLVHFQIMDARRPLALPSAYFDVVHARYICGFIQHDMWSSLLAEVARILKPGGAFISVEVDDLGCSTSPSLTQFVCLLTEAMHQKGFAFNSGGDHSALIAVQPRLFKEAGLDDIEQEAFVLNYSYGMPAHEEMVQDWAILLELGIPRLVQSNGLDEEELMTLRLRAIDEMRMPDFCASKIIARTTGRKLPQP